MEVVENTLQPLHDKGLTMRTNCENLPSPLGMKCGKVPGAGIPKGKRRETFGDRG